MTKEEYEKSRPANEHKIELHSHVIRAYVNDEGELRVLVHRRDSKGHEELPLAYMLGTNALILVPRKNQNERKN